MKSYTNLEQSKKLAKILPIDTADMKYPYFGDGQYGTTALFGELVEFSGGKDIPCWSLSALLNILHSRQDDIVSLSGGGYKDGKYISNWCVDYEYDNGDYQKTFSYNPVDACYEMILKLKELKLL